MFLDGHYYIWISLFMLVYVLAPQLSAFICVYLRPIWFLIRGGLGSHDRSVIEGNFVSDLDAFQHRDIHGVA